MSHPRFFAFQLAAAYLGVLTGLALGSALSGEAVSGWAIALVLVFAPYPAMAVTVLRVFLLGAKP